MAEAESQQETTLCRVASGGGTSPGGCLSVPFRQPVVLRGAAYLARLDGHGQGVLYALTTRTGAVYWYTPIPASSTSRLRSVAFCDL